MAKKQNTSKFDSVDFESAIKDLEKIITKMETGKLSLEENLKSFEMGIALTNHCQSLLSNAEQKVKILMDAQAKTFKDFEINLDSN